MHTLYEIQTDIPTFIHITEAKVHDQRAMDEIPYEQGLTMCLTKDTLT